MSLLTRTVRAIGLPILIGALGVALALALLILSVFRRSTLPTASTALRTAPPQAVAVASARPEETQAPITYQSRGRRDPFLQPGLETARKDPAVNLKVTGIVQGPRSYYALVESELPDGRGYVIHENDVVESARVLKITRHDVIFELETPSTGGRPLIRYVRKPIGP